MAQKRAGIRDVAREAGVSVTTVSHILNNVEFARANEETRTRVKRVAEELNYRPNPMARSLRRRKSDLIGLLSEDIATTPFAGQIILGAQETARELGLTMVLINTTASVEDTEGDAQLLLRQQVDGVLYATMYHKLVSVPSALVTLPTVLIDAEEKNASVPSVVPDELGGARTAVTTLLSAGHRRIGFLNNTDDVPATHLRLAGYREALAAAGVTPNPWLIVTAESETSGGHAAALRLLMQDPRPTALFCYNDRMAMGAYRAAAELGLRIPRDLSIIGFDNQEILCEGLYPELTTMALPHLEMGRVAMTLLAQRIKDFKVVLPSMDRSGSSEQRESSRTPGSEGAPELDESGSAERFEPIVLPCPLIERDSIAPPASLAT